MSARTVGSNKEARLRKELNATAADARTNAARQKKTLRKKKTAKDSSTSRNESEIQFSDRHVECAAPTLRKSSYQTRRSCQLNFLDPESQTKDQIIKSVFSLNDLQYNIFECLKDSEMTVKEISSHVNRDRSTVQRALKKMHEKNAVVRTKNTDRTVYYEYKAPAGPELAEMVRDIISKWQIETIRKL